MMKPPGAGPLREVVFLSILIEKIVDRSLNIVDHPPAIFCDFIWSLNSRMIRPVGVHDSAKTGLFRVSSGLTPLFQYRNPVF